MTNRLRNEATIRFGEKAIRLRPTFECMQEIEDQTNQGFIQLAYSIAGESCKVKDVVTILREGSKAAGEPLSDREIKHLIEEHGTAAVQMLLSEFFAVGLYGGQQADAESEAAKKNDDTQATQFPGTAITAQP